MKNSIGKKLLAFVLSGTMLIGTAVTASAEPLGRTGSELEFSTSRGTLTTETVRAAVYEDEDDGHDGFNGAYSFTNSEGVFNLAGHYPMLISFDVKMGADVGDGTYNIIGKMNNDYGVQILRSGDDYTIQAYCQAAGNNGWPTYKLQNLDLEDTWTSVMVMFDGHAFWLSTTGADGLTKNGTQGNDGFSLRNTEGQNFAVGYNFSEGTGSAIPAGIFLDNVKMYRAYEETEGVTSDAPALAAQLMSGDPIFEADVNVEQNERNLVAIETEYWNQEVQAGTMADQNESDEWLYQVKRESTGEWENIGSEYFYPSYTPETETMGQGSWMQSSDGQSDGFHYSKLTASQITCTFGNTDYTEDAYAWRVQETGYYRATLVNPIGDSRGIPIVVRHSSVDEPNVDGEVLLEGNYNARDTFTSRIAKAEPGDIIRIGSNGNNQWATGFEPAIEKVTVREYAEQYLAEVGGLDVENKTETSAAAFEEAKMALEETLQNGMSDENAIETSLKALKDSVAALEDVADYSAVTAAMERVQALGKDNYTDESWSVLQMALEAVQTGLGVSDQETVDGYAAAINQAIDALVRVYTVTVEGGALSEERVYEYGEMATVTADEPEEGYKFAYWGTVDGAPLCYNTQYSFYVTGDMSLKAYYVEEEEAVEEQVTMLCTSVFDASTDKITFTAKRSLPDGYKVIEHGIIITDSTGWSNFADDPDNTFVLGASRIKKATGKTTGVLGTYTASLRCTESDTWYGRGYVKYLDSEGEEQITYSAVTECAATVE